MEGWHDCLASRAGGTALLRRGAEMMAWLNCKTAGRTHLMEGHVRHVIEPARRDRGSEPGQVGRARGKVVGWTKREEEWVDLAACCM